MYICIVRGPTLTSHLAVTMMTVVAIVIVIVTGDSGSGSGSSSVMCAIIHCRPTI